MFLYVGKTFTATAIGAHLKTVQCEKCSTEFYYEMRRLTTGSGTAPYMIGQESAKNSATNTAQSKLQKALSRSEDPVPCPNCLWVNQSAIRKYRRARHRGWYWLVGLTLFFAGIFNLLFYFDARDVLGHNPDLLATPICITTLIAVFIIVSSLLLQSFFRRRFDPNNQHVNGFPKIPLGTPPPLLKNAAGDYHVPPAVASRFSEQTDWAIIRPGQLIFHPLCVQCLEPGEVPYKLPFTASQALPVPLCRPCLGKIKKQFWLLNFSAAALCFLIGWLLTLLIDRPDLFQKLVIVIFAGGFLTGIGVLILDALLRPYRLQYVDKANAILRIRFRNPAYTALLIRHIAESEGTASKS